MERNKGKLESHAGEEKDKCHYLQGTAVQVSRDIIEIESTYCSVNKRDAIKQQSAGEKCGEDVLGTGFGGVVAVLVESNQCSHRDTCCFQSDEEHQEVSCGNHEVHTQQGRERQHIKFALLDYSVRSFQPLMCHQENNQRTDAEDGLHDALYRGVMVHTTESIGSRTGYDGNQRVYREQHDGQHGVESWITVLLVSIGAHEEVGHEEDHDDSYQRKLFFENKELGIVHIY